VPPMYMPGRFRTASSPLRTWMSIVSYVVIALHTSSATRPSRHGFQGALDEP
jgi:hypothetical protein